MAEQVNKLGSKFTYVEDVDDFRDYIEDVLKDISSSLGLAYIDIVNFNYVNDSSWSIEFKILVDLGFEKLRWFNIVFTDELFSDLKTFLFDELSNIYKGELDFEKINNTGFKIKTKQINK